MGPFWSHFIQRLHFNENGDLPLSKKAPKGGFLSSLKSAKHILEEMGFKKDSKESTKWAFLRHLKKDIQNLSLGVPESHNEPVQLEFDFSEEYGQRSGSSPQIAKKVSNR
ncbi:MAG: hypothetical protein CL676_04820 [Bdellovibrionaceae bacterium]|nr:hypothetical protein [Pseudobdellovibrionaceae bacterium]